jgi:carboxyl-terminal processing protease
MRNDIRRMYKRLVICCALLTIFIGAVAIASAQDSISISRQEYELLQEYKHIEEIRQIIERSFYQEVEPSALIDGAAQGMFSALGDPYSFYYTKEDMDSMREEMTGDYKGIGVQILAQPKDMTVVVVRVFKGSPAEQAGIRAGDKIIQVDDLAVTAYEMSDAVDIMRGGPAGTTVDVTVYRGTEEIKVTVTRGDIHMNNVDSEMLEGNIGYIRLYSFEGTMADEYDKALSGLTEEGMRGLVLDLRDNPGGLTDYAERVAETLLTDELLYYTRDRYGFEVNHYADGEPLNLPLAVLCNGNSASSSEILIGAIQANNAGTIIGEKTFGKGIIQSVYEFPEGDGMQVTTQQYFTPDGRAIHGVGIDPDTEVVMAEDAYDENYNIVREKDNQLQAAIEFILEEVEAAAADSAA